MQSLLFLVAAVPVQFEDLEALYEVIQLQANAEPIDKRLRLAQCPDDPIVAPAVGMSEREALILQLYFVEELHLDEIGETLGVGAARVCQIKKTALDKMKSMMAD